MGELCWAWGSIGGWMGAPTDRPIDRPTDRPTDTPQSIPCRVKKNIILRRLATHVSGCPNLPSLNCTHLITSTLRRMTTTSAAASPFWTWSFFSTSIVERDGMVSWLLRWLLCCCASCS